MQNWLPVCMQEENDTVNQFGSHWTSSPSTFSGSKELCCFHSSVVMQYFSEHFQLWIWKQKRWVTILIINRVWKLMELWGGAALTLLVVRVEKIHPATTKPLGKSHDTEASVTSFPAFPALFRSNIMVLTMTNKFWSKLWADWRSNII